MLLSACAGSCVCRLESGLRPATRQQEINSQSRHYPVLKGVTLTPNNTTHTYRKLMIILIMDFFSLNCNQNVMQNQYCAIIWLFEFSNLILALFRGQAYMYVWFHAVRICLCLKNKNVWEYGCLPV